MTTPCAKSISSIVAGCCALSLASLAHCRPEYSEALSQAAGTQCEANLCIACHQSTTGGGPFSQPFFATLLGAGYDIQRPATAAAALQMLRTEDSDTDGDGLLDAEELAAATNPNATGGRPLCDSAEFGCLSIALGKTVEGHEWGIWLAVSLLAAAAWRRRR